MSQHSLSVRVYRASRPQTHHRDGIYTESVSLTAATAFSEAGHDATTPFLTLPQSFGELMLGERLNCLVCIAHDGTSEAAESPSLLIELESPSRHKAVLAQRSQLSPRMAPSDCVETMTDCELKEAGPHALIVTVTYSSPLSPDLRTLRKLFRFTVSNHLSVRTKTHGVYDPTSSRRETSYLEVQLSNTSTSQSAIQFERLHFDANEALTCTSAIAADNMRLEGGSIRQHLAIFAPRTGCPSSAFEHAHVVGALPLGRLDLGWRSSGGEEGRLQTSSLQRKMPAARALPMAALSASASSTEDVNDLALDVIAAPSHIAPSEPFSVMVRLLGKLATAVTLCYVRPAPPVSEQVASALLASPSVATSAERPLCLDMRRRDDDPANTWETTWLSHEARGRVIEVGGLRAVEMATGRTLREWSSVCKVWQVNAMIL